MGALDAQTSAFFIPHHPTVRFVLQVSPPWREHGQKSRLCEAFVGHRKVKKKHVIVENLFQACGVWIVQAHGDAD